MSKKVLQRLATFFIGIPLVLFILYLPFYHQLFFHIVFFAATLICSCEVYNLLKKNQPMPPKALVLFFTALIPVSVYLCVLFKLGFTLVTLVFLFGFMALAVFEVFNPEHKNGEVDFSQANLKLSGAVFILTYIGYLGSFITRITSLAFPRLYLGVFLVMVFLCDSFAWFFGILFGKSTRGYVKVSPNKSLVGFAGGILGSVLTATVSSLIWPELFNASLTMQILLGLSVALASILGDLVESLLKRSANEKDSGNVIPGRGGLLDSIDSIILAAPGYYLFVSLLLI